MTCLQQLWRKPLLSKKENGSTAEVCKITPEQTKNFWKKSSGQVRQSGDFWPKCISPHLAKTKCIISGQTPHKNCQGW